MISSRGNWGQVNFTDWSPVPSSEFGVITPDPRNPNIIYGVGYGPGGGGSGLVKIDMSTGQWENVAPNFGSDSTKYTSGRDFQKKFDLAFDPGALYVAYQCLLVSRDGAHSFAAASPDLTTAKGAPQIACGKPHPKLAPTSARGAEPKPASGGAPVPTSGATPKPANGAAPEPARGPTPPHRPSVTSPSPRSNAGVIWTVSSNGQIYNTDGPRQDLD